MVLTGDNNQMSTVNQEVVMMMETKVKDRQWFRPGNHDWRWQYDDDTMSVMFVYVVYFTSLLIGIQFLFHKINAKKYNLQKKFPIKFQYELEIQCIFE